jgi:hypothetical protein
MSNKHKFKIENTVYEWNDRYITGQQVRSVGPGIPDNMDLYMKVAGKPGKLIEKNESVDLDMHGIEKFYCQQSSSTAGSV